MSPVRKSHSSLQMGAADANHGSYHSRSQNFLSLPQNPAGSLHLTTSVEYPNRSQRPGNLTDGNLARNPRNSASPQHSHRLRSKTQSSHRNLRSGTGLTHQSRPHSPNLQRQARVTRNLSPNSPQISRPVSPNLSYQQRAVTNPSASPQLARNIRGTKTVHLGVQDSPTQSYEQQNHYHRSPVSPKLHNRINVSRQPINTTTYLRQEGASCDPKHGDHIYGKAGLKAKSGYTRHLALRPNLTPYSNHNIEVRGSVYLQSMSCLTVILIFLFTWDCFGELYLAAGNWYFLQEPEIYYNDLACFSGNTWNDFLIVGYLYLD